MRLMSVQSSYPSTILLRQTITLIGLAMALFLVLREPLGGMLFWLGAAIVFVDLLTASTSYKPFSTRSKAAAPGQLADYPAAPHLHNISDYDSYARQRHSQFVFHGWLIIGILAMLVGGLWVFA